MPPSPAGGDPLPAASATASALGQLGEAPRGSPQNSPADDADDVQGADLARAALESVRQAARSRGYGPRVPARGRGSRAPRRRGWSGPRPEERDPQPLGRLASRMAAERGWTDRISSGAVFGRWAELVGAEVAEHARPVSLADGELTVQAESTAWATQLRLLQRQLLAQIAAGVGNGVVTRLRVRGPTAPSWRHGSRHVPGRGPRDTYG